MIYLEKLCGEQICLRALTEEDCNEKYLGWLNDIVVNQFLETRWELQTIAKISDFVKEVNLSEDQYIFAILVKKNDSDSIHVGNIKIGPIHPHYYYADIGYFIGEKYYWGHGVASEAIKLITAFAFSYLRLNRVQAGVFSSNIGSIKALENNGYKQEGCLRRKLYVDNHWEDHLLFGILKEEWHKVNEGK